MRRQVELGGGGDVGVAGPEAARRIVAPVAIVVGEQAGDERLAGGGDAELEAADADAVVRQAQGVGVELGGEVRAARQPVEVVAHEEEAVAVELRRRVDLAAAGDRHALVQLGRRGGEGDRQGGDRREPAHADSLEQRERRRYDARRMSAVGAILDCTPVHTIDDVIARMRELDDALPPRDGVAYFNRLYLATSENVATAANDGSFVHRDFLLALDVAFANLYFAALRAVEMGVAPPPAWRPLIAARQSPAIAPLQFALAGMNAHINRDLPVALVETFTALTLVMARPSAEATDYDRINGVLARTEAEVAAAYMTPLMQELDREFDGVEDVAAIWCVRTARAAAWSNGASLWHLRAHPTLSADYLATLDRMVGFAGRGLLVATALPAT